MGCFYMPKGHRRSNGTQKVEIIERIRSEQLSFREASKECDIPGQTLQDWERIYLEEFDSVDRLEKAIVAYINYYKTARSN